ncbi:unnamed protein product [Merluccius merluccius]
MLMSAKNREGRIEDMSSFYAHTQECFTMRVQEDVEGQGRRRRYCCCLLAIMTPGTADFDSRAGELLNPTSDPNCHSSREVGPEERSAGSPVALLGMAGNAYVSTPDTGDCPYTF